MKQNLLLKRVAAFWNSTFHTFVKIKLQKTVIIKWVESSPSTIPNAIILLCVETFNAIMEGMGIFWKWGSLIGGVINTLRKLELIFLKGDCGGHTKCGTSVPLGKYRILKNL